MHFQRILTVTLNKIKIGLFELYIHSDWGYYCETQCGSTMTGEVDNKLFKNQNEWKSLLSDK